ncbi:MAG: hypothetical protein NTY65_04745 [Planctomycetota bacterium]|nr:hypothetical protein [Planctomycetota bacterium]
MSKNDSTDYLKGQFAQDELNTHDKEHSIAGYVIRVPRQNLVAVGNDRTPEEQIDAFVDALHWRRQVGKENQELTFRFYSGGENDQLVEDAISTLFFYLNEGEPKNLRVMKDDKPADLVVPDFAVKNSKWKDDLLMREKEPLPELAKELENLAKCNAPSFRWYRNVTEKGFSGRVEGLEVCKLAPKVSKIVFSVGKPGITGNVSKARQRFICLAKLADGEEERGFGEGQIQEAVQLVEKLAVDRQCDCGLGGVEREHYLESRILRKVTPVIIKGIGLVEPVIPQDRPPFQFPTLWSVGNRPRYIDVLGKIGKKPWVLELKESSGGQGEYYRHGITQAVLYRHFVRSAKDLYFWFEKFDLEPRNCQAAVVFPQLRGPGAVNLREDHKAIAQMFDVQIVELDGI